MTVPVWDDLKVLLALSRGGSVARRRARITDRQLDGEPAPWAPKLLIRGGREFPWTAEGRSALECGPGDEVGGADDGEAPMSRPATVAAGVISPHAGRFRPDPGLTSAATPDWALSCLHA